MAGKRKSQAKRPSRSGVPAWIWLLAGILLGLAISVFVLMREGLDGGARGPQPNPEATAPPASEEAIVPEAAPRKPKYDFYTLLPEKEVVIPDEELREQSQRPQPPAPSSGERFLLQAGAFRDARDAEALKAQLALLGLVARVQADTIEGTTWHRVRLGPFADLGELDAAKRQLAANGINAIALREPKAD